MNPPARRSALADVLINLPIWLALVAGVWFAFRPALDNGWVDFDDPINFTQNHDFRGLGRAQVTSAFTTFRLGVYQPIAWLILSVQYAIGGLDPRAFHAGSLALHAAGAVVLQVLFVALLRRLVPRFATERRLETALIAGVAVALYALHPLRVEPVAWASSQPYLPCAIFFELAMLAYLMAHPAGGRRRIDWLAAAQLLAVASILCKASGLSAVLAFLAIDAFVLGRLDVARPFARETRGVYWEKLPSFAALVGFAALGYLAKRQDQGVALADAGRLWGQLVAAGYNVVFYPCKTAWPAGISPFYPLPEGMRFGAIHYAGLVLAIGLSVGLFRFRRRAGWAFAAWAGYLAILLPHVGLLRISNSIAANRYAHIAGTVWSLALAAGLCVLCERGRLRRLRLAAVVGLGVAAAVGLSIQSRAQARVWHDSITLWTDTVALAPGSSTLRRSLGTALFEAGRQKEGLAELERALEIDPENHDARMNLGTALSAVGRYNEAIACFTRVARSRERDANAEMNWGSTLCRLGGPAEAIPHFRKALSYRPDHAEVHAALGSAQLQLGHPEEAIGSLRTAVKLRPWHADAHANLGAALALRGRQDEASAEYAEAIRHDPEHVGARVNLGIAHAQHGQLDLAVEELQQAIARDPGNAEARHALGAVLAQQGRLIEAADEFAEVLRLRPDHPQARVFLAEVRRQREVRRRY